MRSREAAAREKSPITSRAVGMPRITIVRMSLAFGIILILSGCAARRDLVVLLPNPEGDTGSIEVSNQGGSTVISEANSATEVKSPTSAPRTPAKIEDKRIRAIFGDALDAQPRPPEHYSLYFKSDSTELTEDSLLTLEHVFEAIERIKPSEVTVVGHTDRLGSRDDNFRLGLERAAQIKNLLISRGVDEKLIQARSHGEDDPLVKTEDEVPEAKNRRVEIVIL